jgi:hypothetical protein
MEGMLSILRRGTAYQVRYASSNPYDREPQPLTCSDERVLVTLLQHGSTAAWSPGRSRRPLPNCGMGGWLSCVVSARRPICRPASLCCWHAEQTASQVGVCS